MQSLGCGVNSELMLDRDHYTTWLPFGMTMGFAVTPRLTAQEAAMQHPNLTLAAPPCGAPGPGPGWGHEGMSHEPLVINPPAPR